jgi:hypothetical protein
MATPEDMLGFPAAASVVAPTVDDVPAFSSPIDDEFSGLSFDANKWAWLNQGAATAVLRNGVLILEAPASATRSIRSILQTMPAGDFTVTARVRMSAAVAVTAQAAGIVVRNSGGAKLLVWELTYDSFLRLYVQRLTNSTTFSATLGSASSITTQPVYMRVKRVGTNLTFQHSFSGVDWWDYVTEAEATFLAAAVDQVGLFADSQSSTIVRNICDWFRVTRP